MKGQVITLNTGKKGTKETLCQLYDKLEGMDWKGEEKAKNKWYDLHRMAKRIPGGWNLFVAYSAHIHSKHVPRKEKPVRPRPLGSDLGRLVPFPSHKS